MANPAQDRIALDFPELRIAAVKQQLHGNFHQRVFSTIAVSALHINPTLQHGILTPVLMCLVLMNAGHGYGLPRNCNSSRQA